MRHMTIRALACVAVLALRPAAVAGGPTDPAAAAMAGEAVLLDFAAAWCGPCRQMAPLLGEISAAGWVVRRVDVDREPDLVRRFGVTGVPCYVMLVKGQEVGRINGATTRGELEKLLGKAAAPLGAATPRRPADPVAQAAPGMPLPVVQPSRPLATEPPRAVPAAPAQPVPALAGGRPTSPTAPAAVPAAAAEPVPPLAAEARAALERRLLAATARLRVDDGKGLSWGTGTVIDCRQGEALILTCGHIFRDSQGRGRIEVDLFASGASRGVAGQLVSWDLKRDLALVSVFTETAVEAVRVGGAGRLTSAGEPVVTVGCNGGADPTIHHSRITAVDKYLGPPNVQVAGQPVQGRSGGGLFAIDGTLIGVCNAADPADNEGLFAALPAIHEQLEESGLGFVYRATYPSGGIAAVGGSAHVPAMAEEMPTVSFDRRDRADSVPTASQTAAGSQAAAAPGHAAAAGVPLSASERALLDQLQKHGDRAEVICIVRPHGAAAEAESEVFVLNGVGRDFPERLARARGTAGDPAARGDLSRLPPAGPMR